MHILLVNDDGYTAEGILTLERVLREHGHETVTMAPHTQQSAKSHSMTVSGDMIIHRHDETHYSLEGTPADCIIYAVRTYILPFFPDVVVSGINHGYNLSTDTVYSGTCGAARQAAMYGISAIALSAEKDEEGIYDFVSPSEYLAGKIGDFAEVLRNGESFLSLNFPPHWNGKVRKSVLGSFDYRDVYSLRDEGDVIIATGTGYSIEYTSMDGVYPGDRTLVSSSFATATIIDNQPHCDLAKMEKLQL